MSRGDNDHDRFVRKNTMMAQAYEIQKKDDKLATNKGIGQSIEPSCYTCKFKSSCVKFNKTSAVAKGTTSVSFGGNAQEFTYTCNRYELRKLQQNQMTDKQIKALMKSMRYNRRRCGKD